MTDVYLLSEDYYRLNYPVDNSLDMSKFYTVVSLEQTTTVNDILGDDLYKELLYQVVNPPLDADYEGLLTKVKNLLVFSVSRALVDFKDGVTDEDADTRTANLDGKVNYATAKVKSYIEGNSTLSALTGSDATYDADSYSNVQIHYWV